jgi:hypothetical protein
MRFRLSPRAISLVAGLAAATALMTGAEAASPVIVSLIPTELAFAPGADAKVLIRVQADDPESIGLVVTVDNGMLSGIVAPNRVSPGVAEGMAFVRRETDGVATVRARVNGVEVASTLVTFAEPVVGGSPAFDPPLPTTQPDPGQGVDAPSNQPASTAPAGVVAIQANLQAGRDSAARTWRFEVVDAAGNVVVISAFPLSGDAPSVLKLSDVPDGTYTVRPVLGQDAGYSCVAGKLFEITAPVRVVVPGRAEARFTIVPCPAATNPSPQPTIAEPEPTPAAPPAVERAAPLPPATGSGLTDGGSEVPEYVRVTVGLTLLITIAVASLLWRLAARSRR